MADQLLSQADVDALIASLSKADPPKPAAPAAAPAATPPAAKAAAPVTPAPAARTANPVTPAPATKPAAAAPKPSAFSTTASRPAPANFGNMTVVSGAKAAAPVTPASRPAASTAPVAVETGSETISSLSAKVAELTKQLNYLGGALKKAELKVAELEAKTGKTGAAMTDLKIQQLTDEMKKIVTNLKGTPGYGARQTFPCEKCDDQGHVAVQYRCTNCGAERWYGWFPENPDKSGKSEKSVKTGAKAGLNEKSGKTGQPVKKKK